MRRSIGDTGLSAYSMARGSIVFGSANQNAIFFGQELRNDDPNPQIASQQRTRGIPEAELEAGVEYGRPMGHCWLFGQIGLIGQEWFGAGSATHADELDLPEHPAACKRRCPPRQQHRLSGPGTVTSA